MGVQRIDRGMNRIVANLRDLEKKAVKVGFPKGGKPNRGDNNKLKNYTGISEIASVAFFNEFGTRNIPDRPFIRPMFTESKTELYTLKSRLYKQLLKGRITVIQYFNLLGLWGKSDIQKRIVRIRTPQNSDRTQQIKGFDNPLIWSGQMKNSVQYEVVSL